MRSLDQVIQSLGLPEGLVHAYGPGVAKIDIAALDALADRPSGQLVVVTGITPTPLGEGKTTTAIGVAQGLARLGHRAAVALRQASMGPTFGIKGGAAGAGLSQVEPANRLNLHLTGDFHAVTAAHNLLAALMDSHLYHADSVYHAESPATTIDPHLRLDPHEVTWRRVLDVDDRALRSVIVGLGGRLDGLPRQTGFDITAASELMVLVSLATSYADLRARLGRVVVGFDQAGEPVTAEQLRGAGAMAAILRDSLSPNLLQTTEGVPALVHTGPFGNIATGNSSVLADQLGVRLSDFLLTEAGFGSDLGLERMVNVKSRGSGVEPAVALLVATVRAVKAHSGRYSIAPGRPLPPELLAEDPDAVRAGADNLRRHLQIVRGFGLAPVVAINAFPTDHPSEHAVLREVAEAEGAPCAVTTHVADGGAGALEVARALVAACAAAPANTGTGGLRRSYPLESPLADKIEAVARGVYGAEGVDFTPVARAGLERYTRLGYAALPVLVAKTHLSLSADPKQRGIPGPWRLPVREVRLAAGAGFVYAISGDLQTMPGLGRTPAAASIDLLADGTIVGLH